MMFDYSEPMFEVDDEVLCVFNDGVEEFITPMKIYKVTSIHRDFGTVRVLADRGERDTFNCSRFIYNTEEAKASFMRRKLEEAG